MGGLFVFFFFDYAMTFWVSCSDAVKMVKSSLYKFFAVVLAMEATLTISTLSTGGGGSFVAGNQLAGFNCDHVIKNRKCNFTFFLAYSHFIVPPSPTAIEVRKELISRNLDGNQKVIKFIENCIKSVDGWRFKKSDHIYTSSPASEGNSLSASRVPDRFIPYPVRLLLLRQLTASKLSPDLADQSRLLQSQDVDSPNSSLAQLAGPSRQSDQQQYFSFSS